MALKAHTEDVGTTPFPPIFVKTPKPKPRKGRTPHAVNTQSRVSATRFYAETTKPTNRCTCPAAVDITFIGHLPDCPQPQHEHTRVRSSSAFRIGQFELMRTLYPRAIWITNAAGEGMMTEEAHLERVLASYWRKEF